MSTRNAPPFQYSQRAQMFVPLTGQMREQVEEQRDRELEDFIAMLIGSTGSSGGNANPGSPIDEVWIANDAPANPAIELWYDPDAIQGDPTPWVNVGFTGGWSNFGAGYQTAQYRLLGDMVQIRGIIKSGGIGFGAFALPGGMRPPAQLQFPSVAGGAFGYFNITTAGVLVPSAGAVTSFTIDCQFSVTV